MNRPEANPQGQVSKLAVQNIENLVKIWFEELDDRAHEQDGFKTDRFFL